VVQTAAPSRPDPGHCQPDHQQSQTHHDTEGPKYKRDIGSLIAWELLQAGKLAVQTMSKNETAQIRNFHCVTVLFGLDIRPSEQCERNRLARRVLPMPLYGRQLGRLMFQRIQTMEITDESLERGDGQEHPEGHR